MTSTQFSVGRRLLVALTENNEPEFIRILDGYCLQIRRNRLNFESEIGLVINQIREAEIALDIDYSLACWKMVKSAMKDRLELRNEDLLAA